MRVTASELPAADPGERILARLIDGVIFFVPTGLLLFVAFHGRHATLVRLAVELPLTALYLIVPVALWGQTPGKAARKIRVIGPDGGPPGWVRAVRRWLVEALPLTIPLRGLAAWLDLPIYGRILLSDDRRGFHDLFAGTRVVAGAGRPNGPSRTISELRRLGD